MSNSEITANGSILPDFNSAAAVRHRRRRGLSDLVTRYLMTMGGIGVIIAIVLIAFYLLYVVLPMFKPASLEQLASYNVPGEATAETVDYFMEEQHEIGLRVTGNAELNFFNTGDGSRVKTIRPLENHPAEITAYSAGDPSQALLAFATGAGEVLLVKHRYEVTYPDDKRKIDPYVTYPLGEAPIKLTEQPIRLVAAQSDGEQTTIAALTDDRKVVLSSFIKEQSFLSDEETMERKDGTIYLDSPVSHLILDIEQRELYIASDYGTISYYDISDKTAPRLIQKVKAVPQGERITSLEFLSGGISILVGDSRGMIAQWFPVRDQDNNYTLQHIREFDSQDEPIKLIVPEFFRKAFLAMDESGKLGLYHTTAHRTIKLRQIHDAGINALAISPRADAMLAETVSGEQLQFWEVDNEHPEISWKSLWGKVWYESRQQPEYIWQSSSASSDFEPKFSLTPLTFGTFKAAFYAMLFAVPLAIFGAMYTAYFMTPKMRAVVKPSIEIMEALPTVILGFLAGLWLAPFTEKHLPGIFMLLIALPIATILSAFIWQRLPASIRQSVPDGWEAAILIPVLIVAGAIALSLSQPVENLLFNGNMPLWLSQELGLGYDQRNSLVVGLAMGFAVIPTIFSISEDAIYSVPKHLTTGSLALGATSWQTMTRVVLLTASPGIFSAIMIGLGRAVGETMIVVMATGNTAIMDMNIFEGFRALSANIAVEMPESEVGSSHYRILFLAGLVLFIATFVFNTAAEIVRQRLRTKYSTL